MTKDSSIWILLGALAARLDFRQLQVVDHWDADLFATGVARADDPATLVYVSTYQRPAGRYMYECERAGSDAYAVAGHADDVSLERLIEVVQHHLRVGTHSGV